MALRCRGEIPLLGLEDNHAMTDLWSPRRPPLAPPPSPEIDAGSSRSSQICLPSQQHTVAYLSQHLGDGVTRDDGRHSQIVCFHQPSRRFSCETECSSSSCDEHTAEDACTERTSSPDNDGTTLAKTSSPARLSFSEANTVSFHSLNNSDLPPAVWKERYPKVDNISRRAWSATLPIRRSAAARPSIAQYYRPNTSRGRGDQYMQASRALATGNISPPTMRSTSIDPTHTRSPAHWKDVRIHSWPDFNQGFPAKLTYKPGRASPMPPGKVEKSSWDPDSSDEEKGADEQNEQSLGRSRRGFRRRVSDRLRPWSCKS